MSENQLNQIPEEEKAEQRQENSTPAESVCPPDIGTNSQANVNSNLPPNNFNGTPPYQNGYNNQYNGQNMPPYQNGYNNQYNGQNMPPYQNGYNNQYNGQNVPPYQNGYNNQYNGQNVPPYQNGYNNQYNGQNVPPYQNGYNNQYNGQNMPPYQNGYNNQYNGQNVPPYQNGYNNQPQLDPTRELNPSYKSNLPTTSDNAIAVKFTLALLSVILALTPITAIIGLILGAVSVTKSTNYPYKSGLATAAKTLGIIGTCISALWTLLLFANEPYALLRYFLPIYWR